MTGIIKKRQREDAHPEMDKVKKLVQSVDEPTKRLNVQLSASLHSSVKAKASMEGKTIKEVAVELLEGYLKDRRSAS